MYLKTIKLSGFKSFVDPTTIPILSNLTAIVGPNGCGKSNVVDAVRWVVGEISAKQLRGQSMADVIFNGTTGRKPVGKASVELSFDNSLGRIGGEYARFNEISIRREVERDGQSNYFINGVHCRRRDVLDLFLGTGLGPRSYGIIEQGMISHLIEAKPEDLRVYFEEVAGISKYRERRRETEQRIRSTQENLDRLNDLRGELEKQLKHLKRQANAAERYKELKQEERLLQSQIVARQWQNLGTRINEQEAQISQQTNQHEALIADQRNLEMEIEKARLWQTELNDKQNAVQKNYYEHASEIARIEQQIKHIEEQSARWQQELEQAQTLAQELSDNTAEYRQQIEELTEEVEHLKPQTQEIKQEMQNSKQHLLTAEKNMNQCQLQWDEFQNASAQTLRQFEVSKTKIEHYERQLNHLNQRIQTLKNQQSHQEMLALGDEVEILVGQAHELQNKLEDVRALLDQITLQINQKHTHNGEQRLALQKQWQQLQTLESRFASLDALQQAALGLKDDKSNEWLGKHNLQQSPRLGQKISVTPGWELAVETVLNGAFEAVCISNLNEFVEPLTALTQGSMALIDQQLMQQAPTSQVAAPNLLSCVKCDWPLDAWLKAIFMADDLSQAQALRPQLAPHESVITKEGIWLGPNWMRVSKTQQSNTSVLLREQQLQQLKSEIELQNEHIADLTEALKQSESQHRQLETEREVQHQNYQTTSARLVAVQKELSSKQSRHEGLLQQEQRVIHELEDCSRQHSEMDAQLTQAKQQFEEAREHQVQHDQHRQQLLAEREHYRNELNEARYKSQRDQQRADEIEIRISANDSQLSLLKQTMSQAQRQLQQLETREKQLTASLEECGSPLDDLKSELQQLLEQRLAVENNLRTLENESQAHQHQLKQLESQRQKCTTEINHSQARLQELRMEHQTMIVRQTTLQEKITENQFVLDELLSSIPEGSTLEAAEEQLRQTEQRIQRLGPINLAAIEEHNQIDERKNYLDKQDQDLMEALQILQDAIKKIDRETRVKFRETIEQVNEQFQYIFPRVFGGGKAYLELTEDDPLTTGIIVRAQPPGKRNVSIHMLSGGEKALTAISLLFALFRLNPAPFCMLDEVDAPLDDLNVGRFCQLVKEMSQQTQFVVISHNKVTIGMANHLMGVTMYEPGVSRIVSVDMEAAISMAG